MRDLRRVSPRIDVEALCWEVIDDRERSALLLDISTEGARVERPFVGGRIEHQVPLQIEVPGIDEVMWAKGEVVFDRLIEAKANGGAFGLIRRTGYRIAIAAARDLRLLRDYVWDMHSAQQARDAELEQLAFASCYLRG
ncbi:MAG TPA: PilZ domain-containing protein [Kofleriaceae bacterium]